MRILGIETSCDETAAAVYDTEAGLLSNVIYSQIHTHQPYGGVVPELASRNHIKKIYPVVHQALDEAATKTGKLDAIAYTAGPGLMGALLVGASFAHGLGYSLNVPVLPTHHMEGHLLASLLTGNRHKPLHMLLQEVTFPFLALLVSGGHTQLFYVQKPGSYQLLGESLDDAAGEAFDKTARLLDLPYPGGPSIAKLAVGGDPQAFAFPRPMLHSGDLNFSFSGLKTSVLVRIEKLKQQQAWNAQSKRDVAASFQAAVTDTLYTKCLQAIKHYPARQLVVAGGVSANLVLRAKLMELQQKRDMMVRFPEMDLCTDNAAMIAFTGAIKHSKSKQATAHTFNTAQTIMAKPRWPLAEGCVEERVTDHRD